MSKLGNRGIPVSIEEIAIEQGVIENEYNYKLVREHDGLTNQSKDIIWLEWNDEGRFKEKHDNIGVGRSLIMSPFNKYFTWQTTVVTEILASEARFFVY
jgi:YD repeat-containing protein